MSLVKTRQEAKRRRWSAVVVRGARGRQEGLAHTRLLDTTWGGGEERRGVEGGEGSIGGGGGKGRRECRSMKHKMD